MVSLTSASAFSRKSSIWVIAGIIGLLVLLVVFLVGRSVFRSLVPVKPLPATVAFGKIPAFNTAEGITSSAYTFTLQTISGDLPNLPMAAKVFAIGTDTPSFAAEGMVKSMASSVGFSAEPQEISGGSFRFVDLRNPDRVLTINSLSGDMELESNYSDDVTDPLNQIKDINVVKETASVFFAGFGLNTTDYPIDKALDKKYKYENGNLVEVNAVANTNIVEVDFFPADFDKLPVIPASFNKSNIYAFVVGRNVVAAAMQQVKVQRHKFSTYPLKGVDVAFEELKAGKGYFNMKPTDNKVAVREVKLGYVADDNGQYLQPVYLFYGFGDLIAYVPAVNTAWLR